MTLDQEFGARLRAAREKAKMSQTTLGAAIGVSFQQVQKYERGTNRISCSALVGFAHALGVAPQTFFQAPARATPEYIAGYERGARDGKAEGLAEGISRALARLRPSIVELEKQVYEIGPDDPPGDVIALKTYR